MTQIEEWCTKFNSTLHQQNLAYSNDIIFKGICIIVPKSFPRDMKH